MNTATDKDIELCLACATEAILSLPIKGSDIHSREPAPRTIRDILKMPDGPVKREWNRFNLELLGQAHWYLGTRIRQLSNFDIELDQHRYCRSIVKKYLDSAGCPKNNRKHETPLSLEFIPTSDHCSENETKAQELETEYNIDFASCVGSLIYLGMMHPDIS
jgi:hypothetical protein